MPTSSNKSTFSKMITAFATNFIKQCAAVIILSAVLLGMSKNIHLKSYTSAFGQALRFDCLELPQLQEKVTFIKDLLCFSDFDDSKDNNVSIETHIRTDR